MNHYNMHGQFRKEYKKTGPKYQLMNIMDYIYFFYQKCIYKFFTKKEYILYSPQVQYRDCNQCIKTHQHIWPYSGPVVLSLFAQRRGCFIGLLCHLNSLHIANIYSLYGVSCLLIGYAEDKAPW